MRYIILLIALAIAPAHAAHHRQHALDHAADAAAQGAIARAAMVAFLDVAECDTAKSQAVCDEGFEFLGFAEGNLRIIEEDLAEVESLLTGGGDLDEIRRLVNQPHTTDTPKSLLRRSQLVSYRLSRVLKSNFTPTFELSRVIVTNNLIWRSLDRLAWHVTDAYREEVLLDPLKQ